MFHPDPKRIFLRLVLMVVVALSAAAAGSAQTVVYDWSSNSKVPESYPRITRRQNVTFRITNVNDILYSYRLEVTQTPLDPDDFAAIKQLITVFIPPKPTAAANACEDSTTAAKAKLREASQAISADPKLPEGYKATSPHVSVPLRDSIAAWRSHAAIIGEAEALAAQANSDCSGGLDSSFVNAYALFRKSVAAIEAKVNSDHVFVDTHELSPGNNVSVSVIEMFESETISSKTFTFPGSDILTLSAGALFSTIPDRAYEARKTPNSTENVLTVEGNSRATPSIVALLNYSLGALRLDGETAGLALSAGPVVRLGTQSDASTFGFFTGLSGHLYHRFYVTPGIHFGQFSDFPVGFGNGSTIPANFGELTPVKRWTARFGLAITFKTKDFSGITSSGTPEVTSEGSAGGKTKPNDTSTTPTPDTNDVSAALVRRTFLKSAAARPAAPPEPAPGPRTETVSERTEAVSARTETVAPRTEGVSYAQPSSPAYHTVSSEPRSSALNVTSLSSSMSATDERVSINASGSIRDYTMYFRDGRFYLVIPQARLDVLQDDLRGRVFREPLIERRGGNLVLSFVLLPGTRASVRERSNGLDLVLTSPDTTN